MIGSLLLVTALLGSPQSDLGVENRKLLQPRHRFAVVCHRGNHVQAPENTMDAFREAIRVGADYFETDLRTTKDGAIVLMHDGTVDRTTDGHGKVRDLTLSEIRSLKIKNARSPDEKVPTLEEAFDLAHGHIHIYLDIKDVTPQQVLPLLRAHRMERNVIAYLYSGIQIDQWRDGAPTIPIIADFGLKQTSRIEPSLTAHPFAIFDGPAQDLSPENVQELHRLHVLVWPDVQNPNEGPDQWRKFMDMGIDGFQTDHPEALIAYLKAQKLR